MDAREGVAGLYPVDLVRIEEKNLPIHFDADPVFRRVELTDVLEERTQLSGDRRSGRILETLLGTIQRLVKSHVIDRLEQLVERTGLECRHRIVVERGDEDQRPHFIG